MADEDFDVEALLEAPYVNGGSAKIEESKPPQSHTDPGSSKKRSRSRSPDRDRANRDVDRERDRDGGKRDRDRDNGDRDKYRGDKDRSDRDKDRDKNHGDRDRDRNDHEKDRGKDRGGDRDRDRDKDRTDRDRDKDKDRNDRDKDRDRDKDKDRSDRDKDRSDRDKDRNDRDKDRDRDKDKERGDRDKDRDRDKERSDREKDRDRDHDRDKDKDRRDRDRDKDKDRNDRDKDHDKDRDRNKEKDRSDRDKDRDRDKDKDRDRGRDDDRRDRRRDDDKRDRDRRDDRRRSRSRSRDRKRDDGDRRRRSRDRSRHRTRTPSPVVKKPELPELTPEERDARTVICMQLASRIRPEDLEEFFSSVGKVTDVRLVTDRKRKSKGIAYIEFLDVESVPLAIALTNQRLLGVPIVVQLSHAEKNRLAAMQAAAAAAAAQAAGEATNSASAAVGGAIPGAAKLYVGSLHYNISEEMLKAIFEPFGKLLDVSIVKDQKTGQSQGFAFITFRNADDASVALVQMNGFPLAGRPLKVGRSERSACFPDIGEVDKIGTMMAAPNFPSSMMSDPLAAATAAAAGITSGLGFGMDPAAALMLGSAAGLGLDPTAGLGLGGGLGLGSSASLLGMGTAGLGGLGAMAGLGAAAPTVSIPPITTECLLVSNMFDPTKQLEPGWDDKLCDDVVRECARNGAAVTHIAVDRQSPQGNVYLKCDSPSAALVAVNALHGRFFDGRLVTVGYIPSDVYHVLFPGAASAAPSSASNALAASGK